jgi:C1A family cysteine protease
MPVRRVYGQLPDRPDQRDYLLDEHVRLPAADALPTSVDLRTSGHLSWPLYDQGQLGSCTANAVAGALRYTAGSESLPDLDPSRLWIYYQERVIEGSVGTDAGAEIRDGLKVVSSLGFPPEADWPYDIARFADAPPAAANTDAKADRATKYMRVTVSQAALRQALAAGFAVVVGFTVYESFESDAVASSGEVPMPVRGEQVVGGHAVLCVGYDDHAQRFLCRNSWGADWGQGGYFTIPYGYLGSSAYASDFWSIELVAEGSGPTPTPTPTDPLHELAALLRQFVSDVSGWLTRHNL